MLFAPSQPLSRKVRCIEIVYVPLTQNVSCIFKIFKHSQHKMKYINFIRRFFFGLYFEQNRIHTRSYRSENFICITWKWPFNCSSTGRRSRAFIFSVLDSTETSGNFKIIEGYTVNVNQKRLAFMKSFY